MSDIYVVAKRKFRFTHPSLRSSEELAKAISQLEPNKALEGYFDIEPDQFRAQKAPEWIKEDALFDLAVKAGDIFEAARPAETVAVAKVEPPSGPILATTPPEPEVVSIAE